MFPIDIDECKVNNGGCSQRCVNYEPGYSCQCEDGWFLSDDLKTCFGEHITPTLVDSYLCTHTLP